MLVTNSHKITVLYTGKTMSNATQTPTKRPIIGYALYLLAATCFAINGTASKVILQNVDDATRVVQFRATGAALILIVYVAIRQRNKFKLSRRELWLLPAYGIAGMAFAQWFYYEAMSRMPISIALLLQFTAPIFVVLWVRFVRKEPVKWTIWIGLLLAFIGLAMAAQVWDGFNLDPVGFFFSILSMIALVIFFLLGDHVGKERDAVSVTMWALIFASSFWAIARPIWDYPWHVLTEVVKPFTTSDMSMPIWPFFTYMVIFGTVVPFVLAVMAIKHIGGAGASIMALSEVPVASAIAWIALGEVLHPIQIVGSAVVVIGIIVAEKARSHSPSAEVVAENSAAL